MEHSYEMQLEEKDIEEAVMEASKFVSEAKALIKHASRKLADMNKEEEEERLSTSSSSTKALQVKLPKLELAVFAGDVTEWSAWWDSYEATVHNSDLPEVSKFSYLRSLLTEDVRKVIKGLSLTSAHYKVACELLQQRYGRKEPIVFSHIQSLMTLEAKGQNGLQKLHSLQDQILVHVRSLEALGIDGGTYGVFMTPLILSRLPMDVRMEWARNGEGKEGKLDAVLDFLKVEIQRRERAESFKVDSQNENPKSAPKKTVPTASALHGSTKEVNCGVCNKRHETVKCFKLKNMDHQSREKAIRDSRLCFRCLSPNHIARKCDSFCSTCNGKHHKLLCHNDGDHTETQTMHAGSMSGYVPTQVLMQMAKVQVKGPKGLFSVNMLFDSGSDKSYISTKVAKMMGLRAKCKVNHSYAVFGGVSGASLRNVHVFDVCKDRQIVTDKPIEAIELPTICASIYRPKLPHDTLRQLGDLELAPCSSGKLEVDVLIGLGFYWNLICAEDPSIKLNE